MTILISAHDHSIAKERLTKDSNNKYWSENYPNGNPHPERERSWRERNNVVEHGGDTAGLSRRIYAALVLKVPLYIEYTL